MKKINSKQKVIKNNYKISTFFTKISRDTPNNVFATNSEKAEDDIIPPTPLTNENNPKTRILDAITNVDLTSKRKIINSDNKDLISTSIVNSPPRKKFNSGCENIAIPSSSTSNIKSINKKSPMRSRPKTPKKLNIHINSPRKTPTKTRSAEKLFEKSPTNGFNVEILENFVRVTPSKSSVKSKSPASHSSSKRQLSILNYISPSKSQSAKSAQKSNEQTPEKSPIKNIEVAPYSKAKINLNLKFASASEFVEEVVKVKDNIPPPDKLTENLETLFDFDDSSWEKCEIEQYLLDLSTPQHCRVTNYSKEKRSVLVTVKCTKTSEQAVCKLEGFWIWSKINIGCIVYLTAVKDTDCTWKVTNEYGLLVYEPDILISNTAVVGALFCKRQSIFKEKFMGFEPENKVMVVGILIHTLLQGVLKIKTANVQKIENMLREILSTRSTIKMMYNTSLTFDDLKNELMQFVPRIVKFMEDYVLLRPNGGHLKNNWTGKIDSIQDIEENIWCPELGIKGKIDVSISSNKITMPVELKTGRARVSLEHRGQVMLYILMMLKLGYTVSSGLLLYLREGVLQEIPYNEREKRDLILLRNELTYYLTRKVQLSNNQEKLNGTWNEKLNALQVPELPEPINHHSACQKCPYNVICCSYLKYDNTDLSNNQALNSVKEERLSHLSDLHIQYFIHFSNLLNLENSEKTGKHVSVIYTKTPHEREKLGKCITFIKLIKNVTECDALYEHTFGKVDVGDNSTFLTSGIGESSYVVVSTNQRPAVASGIVSSINPKSISVILDRNLNSKYQNLVFHIDSYDSNSIFSFNFTSLAILLEATEQAGRLRRLIIDKEPPIYKSKLPKIIASKAPPILKRLNRTQQHAVLKACGTQDYLLIKGMPGAGKTATIIALIELLVELGNSVLITSHTHAAVDNVCVRLKKQGVKVLRLGAVGRIHSEIQTMSEYELTKNCKTPEQLEQVYANAKVLAVTCLGMKHPIFNKRMVDFCIVDESTQVMQCTLFRAISVSKKFILIGDPDQLPPVVRNDDAMKYGLSESLFERLQNPDATVTLNLNYRMNHTITKLANNFMYDGKLQVANEITGNAVLKIPNLQEVLVDYKDEEWLIETLDESLENAVKVLDTGPTWQNQNLINANKNLELNVNTYEIAIVNYLITALMKGGVSNNSIGVISPYTAQVSQLCSALRNKNIDVNTVDQFQGRDKEIIIFSCTSSQDPQKGNPPSKYHILEDNRRLNVAITRAKYKLILIGDLVTLRKYKPFKQLLDQISPHCFVRLNDGERGFNWSTVERI